MVAAGGGGFAPPAAAGTPKAVVLLELNGVPGHKVQLDCFGKPTCDLPAVSDYPVWSPTSHSSIAVPEGFSAAELATAAEANVDNVWEMVIENDPNPPVPGSALTADSYYPPGQFSPVFYTNGNGVSLYRQPPATATDGNTQYTQTVLGKMTVNFITVNQIPVAASVDHQTAKVGGQLNFTVTTPVDDVRPDETLSVKWDFGDGQTASSTLHPSGSDFSATTTHVYRAVGTYRSVTATVSGDRGSGGSGTAPTITIGKKASSPGPGSTDHRGKKPVTGSSHKTRKQPTTPSTGTGQGTGTPQPQTTLPATTTPTSTQPPPVTQKKPPLPKVPSLPGTQVSGVLLSAPVTQIAEPAGPSAAQGPGGTTTESVGGGIPGAVGGIGLAVLLLVGGFLSEGLPAVRWR